MTRLTPDEEEWIAKTESELAEEAERLVRGDFQKEMAPWLTENWQRKMGGGVLSPACIEAQFLLSDGKPYLSQDELMTRLKGLEKNSTQEERDTRWPELWKQAQDP